MGKSTVIKRVIELATHEAGGFYTREVRKSGQRTGFEIVTLAGQSGYLATKEPALAFSHELPFGQYRVNLEAIDHLAVPALLQAQAEGHIVVIGEIGPMELLSARFGQAVLALLDSQVAVLGTIMQRGHALADQVKAHPRIIMQEVTVANRNQLLAQVYDHLSRHLAF